MRTRDCRSVCFSVRPPPPTHKGCRKREQWIREKSWKGEVTAGCEPRFLHTWRPRQEVIVPFALQEWKQSRDTIEQYSERSRGWEWGSVKLRVLSQCSPWFSMTLWPFVCVLLLPASSLCLSFSLQLPLCYIFAYVNLSLHFLFSALHMLGLSPHAHAHTHTFLFVCLYICLVEDFQV